MFIFHIFSTDKNRSKQIVRPHLIAPGNVIEAQKIRSNYWTFSNVLYPLCGWINNNNNNNLCTLLQNIINIVITIWLVKLVEIMYRRNFLKKSKKIHYIFENEEPQ